MDVYTAPANILCGQTTTPGGTIITIPAGRVWIGTVSLSAGVIVASAGAAVQANARISVTGAGAQPPAGDYARLDLHAPASLLGAIGTAANDSISVPMTVAAPAGNSVSLVLNTTNTTVQNASASGVLRYAHGN